MIFSRIRILLKFWHPTGFGSTTLLKIKVKICLVKDNLIQSAKPLFSNHPLYNVYRFSRTFDSVKLKFHNFGEDISKRMQIKRHFLIFLHTSS
jgi:hypothetical protein